MQNIVVCGNAPFPSITYLPEGIRSHASTSVRQDGDPKSVRNQWRTAGEAGRLDMTLLDTQMPSPAVQEMGNRWPDPSGKPGYSCCNGREPGRAFIWKLVYNRRTTDDITAAVRSRFPDAPYTNFRGIPIEGAQQ